MISIIIPTYEREKTLEAVLPSYLEQKYVKQLIIINDASKRCTYDKVVEECKRCCAQKDIEFVYVKNIDNMGAAYCRNLGIEKATQRFILWGEDDLYLQMNYLEVLRPLVDDNKAACGTIIYDIELDESDIEIQKKIIQQQEVDRPLFDFNLLEGYFRLNVVGEVEIPFAHAILLVPRKAYDHIVYYEKYKKNGYREETDAQIQMAQNGLTIIYSSKTKCFHLKRVKEDKGGQHANSFLMYEIYKIKNNNIFLSRHYNYFRKKYNVKRKIFLKLYFDKKVFEEVAINYLGKVYHFLLRKGKCNV